MSFGKEDTATHGPTQVNRMALRPMVGKDFSNSKLFLEEFGQWVTATGMFLPSVQSFDVGQEIELKFTLDGRKDIVAGTARVVFVRDGSSGKRPGCGVKFVELTPRSRKNLEMIRAWRDGS